MAGKTLAKKRKLADMSVDEFMSHGFDQDIVSDSDNDDGKSNAASSSQSKVSKMKKKEQAKRKLKDLSVDEFLSSGFDSDIQSDTESNTKCESIGIEEENTDKEPNKTGVKRPSKHKLQLEKLKDKDPSFYKFLQENDKELLDFDASDDSDEDAASDIETDVEEDEEDQPEVAQEQETAGVVSKGRSKHEKKMQERIEKDPIPKWKMGLENDSVHDLRKVLRAFHSAMMEISGIEEDGDKVSQSRIKGTAAFNALTQLCLKSTFRVLQHHLKNDTKAKSGKRMALPSTHPNWSSVKRDVHNYLKDLLQLLRQMSDPNMLAVVLKHTQEMCPYFACFPKIIKMLIKRLIRMWSTGEEHVSVLAFLNIRQCALLMPMLFEFTLKNMYMGYVKNSKFVTAKSWSMLVFMQNSLIEFFSLDVNIAYQHGFVYIRQMAIHLRNAIMDKKKESFKAIYNWQFISCLQLWTRAVAELHCDTISPLIYPIVQVTLSVIRLVPTMKYYPLRFLCLRSLNMLAAKTDVFIPVPSFILEILESPEFNKKSKASTSKPPSIQYSLKVPKGDLQTNAYKEVIIDNICDVLLEHYCIHSSSIAFPELIFPTCHRIRKFNKTCKITKFTKQMKQVIEKLEETAQDVTHKRSGVTFSPKDINQVRRWESELKIQPSRLQTFYESWKKLREAMLATQQRENDEDALDADSSDEDAKKPKQGKEKKNDKKGKVTEMKKKGQNAGSKGNAKKPKLDTEDDIVEDFTFSDSDGE